MVIRCSSRPLRLPPSRSLDHGEVGSREVHVVVLHDHGLEEREAHVGNNSCPRRAQSASGVQPLRHVFLLSFSPPSSITCSRSSVHSSTIVVLDGERGKWFCVYAPHSVESVYTEIFSMNWRLPCTSVVRPSLGLAASTVCFIFRTRDITPEDLQVPVTAVLKSFILSSRWSWISVVEWLLLEIPDEGPGGRDTASRSTRSYWRSGGTLAL